MGKRPIGRLVINLPDEMTSTSGRAKEVFYATTSVCHLGRRAGWGE